MQGDFFMSFLLGVFGRVKQDNIYKEAAIVPETYQIANEFSVFP